MTARKAAHSLQRAKGALASGFATVDLHHATGHDRSRCPCLLAPLAALCFASRSQRFRSWDVRIWLCKKCSNIYVESDSNSVQ